MTLRWNLRQLDEREQLPDELHVTIRDMIAHIDRVLAV